MRRPSIRAAALGLSAVLIPVLWIGFDLFTRGAIVRAAGADLSATYAAGILLSLLVWGLGMEAARHPRRSVRIAALAFLGYAAAFGIGLQTFVRALTHAYVGRRALMLAIGVPDLGRAGYFTDKALIIGGLCLVPAALAVGLAMVRARRFGPRIDRPSMAAAGAAAAVVVAVFTPFAAQGFQCLPPDVLWLNGTGGPLLAAVGLIHKPRSLPAGRHEPLPSIAPAIDASAPPIVLVLGESVRRDAVCLSRTEGCTKSPRLDAAAPDRIGFARAFAVASCTELVSTALWTGLAVTADPEAIARAPLVWDYAKARGYRTAYLSSQSLLYQQSDLFLRGSRIDLFREARDRQPDARVDEGSPDEATTGEAIDFIEKGGPAFVVVHYANTHAPYRKVPGYGAHPEAGASDRDRYENSLAHNDAVVADLIDRLRRSERGRRAVVLFASDHGEAFGEHGSSTHSFDLYAEQIDVPLWIDAPEGSLPEGALARLGREAPSRPVAIYDLTATVLDLMGALDAPALADRTRKLAGASLLRDPPGDREILIWNCPPTRECPAEAFGVVKWPLKLHYVGHEARYACHDVQIDPGELSPLDPARCAALRGLLDERFGARVEAR
jgi:glucan phosphoethanolaminetransferase (alkaline phosphatase superfamily)